MGLAQRKTFRPTIKGLVRKLRGRLPQSREVWLVSIGWHISAVFLLLTLWLFQDFPELSFLALFVSIYVHVVVNRRLAERKLKAHDKSETIRRRRELEAVRQDLTTHLDTTTQAVRQDLTTHLDTTTQAVRQDLATSAQKTIKEAYVASSAISHLTQKMRPLVPLRFSRGWSASPELLSLLYELILRRKPQFVLDIGSGMTTVVAGHALRENGSGTVVAWDHLSEFADETREQIRLHNLVNWATVITSPLEQITLDEHSYLWYSQRVPENQMVDLVIVDGPPGSTNALARYPAGPIIGPSLSADAALILDDVDRSDEKEVMMLWSEKLGWKLPQTLGQQGKSLFGVFDFSGPEAE